MKNECINNFLGKSTKREKYGTDIKNSKDRKDD